MNKYQEALDTLVKYAQNNPDVKWVLIHEENLLQKLVDKETPMKPIKLKSYRNVEYDACPKCNTNVYLDDHDYYLERCEECGQKIDWT